MRIRLLLFTTLLAVLLTACPGASTDTTAPTMTSSLPANNATGVPVSANITLTFSEPMKIDTVTVFPEPKVRLGQGTWNAARTALELNPPLDLNGNTTYSLTLDGQDDAGNALGGTKAIVFKTAPDTTAPVIASSAPVNGAVDVPLSNQLMTVTFSEEMDMDSLAATVSVSCRYLIPNCNVPGWSITKSFNSLTVNVTQNALTEATYTVNVSGKDLVGNSLMASPLKFTTIKDTTEPTAVELLPANGSRGIARDAALSVSFSEPMSEVSLSEGIHVFAGNTTVPFSITRQPGTNTYTIQPSTPLPYGSDASLSLNTNAKDLSGNPLAQAASTGFKVINLAVDIQALVIASQDGTVTRTCNTQTNSCNTVANNTNKNFLVGRGDITGQNMRVDYRGFVGFYTGDIRNQGASKIISAKISVGGVGHTGDPFATQGNLLIDRVNYGVDVIKEAFDTPTLGCGANPTCTAIMTSAPERDNLVDVTPMVVQDFADGLLTSQFRLRFAIEPQSATSYLRYSTYENAPDNPLYWPVLFVTYEYP